MVEPGRNELCPCGSGKKFKRCCGSSTSHSNSAASEDGVPKDAVAAFFDESRDAIVFVKSNTLINQLNREGPRIASSFDRAFGVELKEISEEFSRTFALLIHGSTRESRREQFSVRYRCCPLLLNAAQGIVAALDLVRHGFRLQPGILIRTSIETLCVALSLFTGQTSVEDYDAGKLHSPKAVSHAKKVVPMLGQFYGFFSRQFAHLGDLHKQLHSWGIFERDDEAATMNLSFVKTALNVLTIATDLILYDYTRQHRYWKKLNGDQYAFEPSDAEREWQKKFLAL